MRRSQQFVDGRLDDRDLSVGTGAKEIETVETVDSLARPLVNDVAMLPGAADGEEAEAAE